MTIPPPPESYFEGGEPQSEVAPGDTGRELLHDVKNLTQAIALLRKVVEKQRLRQQQIIATSLISLLVLVLAIGYSRYLAVHQTQDRIGTARVACERDNARGLLEIGILEASAKGNPDPRAQAFFAPRIAEFKALQKDCNRLYPREGEKGWPSFWSVS